MKKLAPVLLIGIALGCGRTCPPAYRVDASRSQRLEALLGCDPEGAPLLAKTGGRVSACFSPGGAGVAAGSMLLLDQNADDPHLAARAAHLLVHQSSGQLRTSGDPHAADEERATALERRILARLISEH